MQASYDRFETTDVICITSGRFPRKIEELGVFREQVRGDFSQNGKRVCADYSKKIVLEQDRAR